MEDERASSNVGDQTGETTIKGGNIEDMDTSCLNKVADALLSRSSSAGGSEGGSRDGQHQEKMPPPPCV